ncbi:MAG: coenzyme F420-0:L-glutamate ligase [Myxococcota bacterium]|jgi:coenzyme F420-0:L-glutamate ligase / coenzyme F420-1:gamma-L-glutamate ligase|nr:coenzyme F420-0:L-glutamate ligase [Myxococcota bacterium]
MSVSEKTGTTPGPIQLTPLADVPAVQPGDDLADLLHRAAESAGVALGEGVLVVCQKIVSKAEGKIVALADVEPRDEAIRIAKEDDKDPRHVEIVLRESARIVRRGRGVMICETRHGMVCANAGVDLSNTPGSDVAVLLPDDSDASARRLAEGLAALGHSDLAVVISDTFGRPWREGLVDVAIGSSGIAPIADIRGSQDWMGRELQVTTMATVDQLAAAAGLLMIKDAGIPAVFVEGVPRQGDGGLSDLLRNPSEDLFR